MNYLELGQELHREGRFSGAAPITMQGQTGQTGDIAAWVKNSWQDIQLEFDGRWKWLWREFQLKTIAPVRSYAHTLDGSGGGTGFKDIGDNTALDTRFSAWMLNDKRKPPKIYLESAGTATEQWLIWTRWEDFEQVYGIGTQNPAMPVHITINPQDHIVLGPAPNDVYIITGDYWRTPQEISLDTDVPDCPKHYHRAISYYALAKYGYANVAQEHVLRAGVEGLPILSSLRHNQGADRKRWRNARPMA